MWATSIGSTPLPQAGPPAERKSESRRHRDPCTRQGDDRGGVADQLREALDARRRWRGSPRSTPRPPPLSAAFEVRRAFAEEGRNALLRVSPLSRKRHAKPSFSAAMPASRSPSAETRLDLRHRERRLSGKPPLGPHQGGVQQFVVVDYAVDEPELEGFLGEDRVADEVHLERLVGADEPRQPLGAAEARDDAELDLGLAEQRRARGDPVRRTPSRARCRRRRRGRLRRRSRRSPARSISRSSPCVSSSSARAPRLVHRREGLDVGAGAEQHRVGGGEHERAGAVSPSRAPTPSRGPR